jgi:hypothetical protein
MLSSGETAFRVRRSMGVIASGLGFEWLSVQLGARNRSEIVPNPPARQSVRRHGTLRSGGLRSLLYCGGLGPRRGLRRRP